MANVTKPIILDETGQDIVADLSSINTNLNTVNSKLQDVVTAINNSGGGSSITVGTTQLTPGSTILPDHNIHFVYTP